MKYFVRRLLTGIVIVPLTGVAYVVLCALAVAWGAGQNNSVAGYFGIGCWFGVALTIAFAVDALRKAR